MDILVPSWGRDLAVDQIAGQPVDRGSVDRDVEAVVDDQCTRRADAERIGSGPVEYVFVDDRIRDYGYFLNAWDTLIL